MTSHSPVVTWARRYDRLVEVLLAWRSKRKHYPDGIPGSIQIEESDVVVSLFGWQYIKISSFFGKRYRVLCHVDPTSVPLFPIYPKLSDHPADEFSSNTLFVQVENDATSSRRPAIRFLDQERLRGDPSDFEDDLIRCRLLLRPGQTYKRLVGSRW